MATITMDEVVHVLYRNGVTREDQLATMTAIASAESALDPELVGRDPDDLGLWQINIRIHDTVTREQAFDYQHRATQYAIGLMRSTRGYKHWSVYTTGYHRKYLKLAWDAVRRVQAAQIELDAAPPRVR